MASEVLEKFSALSTANISLDGLLGSASQVGRQSDFIDNSTTRYSKLLVYAKTTLSGTTSGSRSAVIYGLRGDGAFVHRTDGASTGDSALTFLNAPVIGVMGNKTSPSAGDTVYGEFIFDSPGPRFAFGISHDMCTALSPGTGANWIRWIGVTSESL